ncbi:DsbE family thiol:disulfide interchange protein [Pelomonas sp. P7]|uniref:DsbE family thiol:disulfide interchange protein n=1 Tax=Pelomonas caseinilytica TaxID=2906763 RepID=A0ABS8XFI4_9BURK|nr:DsbE family thiol:disulfide interchange protein [Pelomonas sp. P7]MCE4536025.1 DsbE family thiol:disulfide interchange protein [Pelomonas sp. P7]
MTARRRRLWPVLLPLVAFGALVAVLAVGLNRDPREVPSPLIGKPAPPLLLPRLDDPAARVSGEALKGKVWMLNVWASWCGACREEHPMFVAFAKRQAVPIYGLDYKDTRYAGQDWLRRLGNPYVASAFDEDGRAGLDWGVYGVPETFIIDARGVVRHKHIGPVTPEVLKDSIEPLLAQLQAEAAGGTP